MPARVIKSKSERYLINSISFILIALVAILILLPQLKSHAFILGTDSDFHMNRFYETAMQIKTGHFSYFQMLFGFARSGRIINALYGPLIAYAGGLLLLITHSWYNFEIANTLIELVLSGLFTYILCEHNNIKRWASLLISALYMVSYPITIWITAQEFTGWGAVLMPLALMYGTDILDKHSINPFSFAIVMSLLVEVHLISSAIAVVALIPFFIVGEIHTKYHLHLLNQGLQALGLTVLLTSNVWGTIFGIFRTNHIIPIFPQQNLLSGGIVFQNGAFTSLGVSLTIITLMTICFMALNWSVCDYRTKTPFFVGLVFLWLSSQYFPWNTISKAVRPISDLLQFPRRLLVIGILLTLVSFGRLISLQTSKSYATHTRWVIFTLSIFLTGLSIAQFNTQLRSECDIDKSGLIYNQSISMVHTFAPNQIEFQRSFYSHHLNRALLNAEKSTPDYLPTKHKVLDKNYYALHPYHYDFMSYELPFRNHDFKYHIKGHNTLKITFNNHSDTYKHKTVPVTAYHQSVIHLNHHLLKHHHINNAGALKIDARPGKNTITSNFHPDKSITILTVVMIISWLFILSKVIL